MVPMGSSLGRQVEMYTKEIGNTESHTGDGAKRDSDGYYWITGRVDDVLNVSGHRLGTAEIEGAVGSHRDVAEAAIVGYPHELKGQGIYAYVTLMTGKEVYSGIENEINLKVKVPFGKIKKPLLL